MGIILSIETATSVCSVALHRDGQLLGHQELFVDKSHSGLLTVLINDLVRYCGSSLADLDAVAVSEGPGSYTGLRIGTSTAKGLAYSLDIPMIAVNTLEAMAVSVAAYVNSESLLCPMIDARRMEVYCMLVDPKGGIVQDTHPKIITEEAFQDQLDNQELTFFGNGAAKCKETITHANARFMDGVTPTAKSIGVLAQEKFTRDDFVDVAYFEPFYLKDFRPTTPKNLV